MVNLLNFLLFQWWFWISLNNNILNKNYFLCNKIDNGVKSGPYRVWLKTQNYPGLAMSRSIGDLVAASIGVTCEPGKC